MINHINALCNSRSILIKKFKCLHCEKPQRMKEETLGIIWWDKKSHQICQQQSKDHSDILVNLNDSCIKICWQCDNMPGTAGPHYLNFLNQLITIWSSSGPSHVWLGAFHILYKHTTDTTYITKSGRKKKKQAWTWVSPKHKKGEVWALLLHSVLRCLSQTVANSPLLLTALGPCLSSSSSGLVGNLVHKPFVWVSRQSRQRNPLTGTHPHLHPQKWMPSIIPQVDATANSAKD